MKATVTAVDQHKVSITIEIPAEDVKKGFAQAVKRIAGQVNIPGFRKGKAPRKILEMNYGKEAIAEEAFELLAGRAYTEALRENEIVPVSNPEIEREQFEEGKDLIFKATVVKQPEVTLGDYKGLEVEKQDATITDEQVEEQLNNIRSQQAKMVAAPEDATVQKDDFATIDFKGFIDGEAFDGGEGKSYPLQIGSGSFIPGFEDQLIGHKAGEDVTVTVSFPEDYFVAELAGKEAKFECHIHDIKRKELPEITDEFVRSVSVGQGKTEPSYNTAEEFVADLRKRMEDDAARRAIDAYNAGLVELAVKNATVDIPEIMIEDRAEQMVQELAMNLEGRGLKLEDYLKFSNKTIEELREENKAAAAENVRADLVLDEIAKAEGVEVTPEDMNYEIFAMSQQFGADPKEVYDIIVKEGRVSMLASSVARKKAARLIIENAKGAEKAE